MAEQSGDKTHEATPHRRQQAREQGQIPRSQDLASAALLVGSVMILMYFGKGVWRFLGELTQRQLGGDAWLTANPNFAVDQWNSVIFRLGQTVLPIFGLLVVVAIAVHLGQVGVLFLPQKLAFDLKRVSPLSGIQRLLSLSNVVRLAFGIFKIGVVVIVAGLSLWGQIDVILSLSEQEVAMIAVTLVEVVTWTCLKIGAALLVLAILDYGFQRWKHERDLKMTTQEMREEMKTTQGDPQIIARRRAVQRQLVLNRMNNAVPDADFTVTNPTELAISIKYDHEKMSAPMVVAKGAGLVAQRIRRLSLEHGVPVIERKELARFLFKHVDVGQQIPAEKYAAIAELLRYVYQLKGKTLPGMEQAA